VILIKHKGNRSRKEEEGRRDTRGGNWVVSGGVRVIYVIYVVTTLRPPLLHLFFYLTDIFNA